MSETALLIPCIGCGAMVPDISGPAHSYMGASPGCWAIFGEVNAAQFSSRRLYATHHLTVDAYAVQHPGKPSPQAIRSVAVHLVRLYWTLEKGATLDAATAAMRRAIKRSHRFAWLEPPSFAGTPTVLDVRAATSEAEHIEKAAAWAQAMWRAWSPYHPTIRDWAEQP